MSGPVRVSRVAGTWYPKERRALSALLDECLTEAPRADLSGLSTKKLTALVSPHAGLQYSGRIAASGYRLLEEARIDRVLLLGPCHQGGDGIGTIPKGALETPLGRIPVDEELCLRLERAAPEIREAPEMHDLEHSLEMQYPFLQRFLPGVPVAPLLMGYQTPSTIAAAARAIEEVVSGIEGVLLLVASSDLSHYETRRRARSLDSEVIERLERFDPAGLLDLLRANPHHACGGGPMVAVLTAARALGASESRVLAYGDSGDVTGDTSAVVGYVSAAFFGA